MRNSEGAMDAADVTDATGVLAYSGPGAVRQRPARKAAAPARQCGGRRRGERTCRERRCKKRRCGDQGAVTAEAAMTIPVLVIFALALLWALMAASAQIRCVDAARAGARAAARSEPEAQVRETALSAAPGRARVQVERAGDLWRVSVTAPTPGPGPLAVTLSAEAAAAAEDTVGAVP